MYCPSMSFFPLDYLLSRVGKTWNLDRNRTAQLDGALGSCVNPIHPPQYSVLRTPPSPLEPPSSLQCSKQTPVLPSTSPMNLVPSEAPIYSYTCESLPKSILEPCSTLSTQYLACKLIVKVNGAVDTSTAIMRKG